METHKFSIESRKTEQEEAARLRREEAQTAHDLWRDKAILRVCLVAFPLLATVCVVILFFPGQRVEIQTWACSTLTGIASGVVSYSLGKSRRPSD